MAPPVGRPFAPKDAHLACFIEAMYWASMNLGRPPPLPEGTDSNLRDAICSLNEERKLQRGGSAASWEDIRGTLQRKQQPDVAADTHPEAGGLRQVVVASGYPLYLAHGDGRAPVTGAGHDLFFLNVQEKPTQRVMFVRQQRYIVAAVLGTAVEQALPVVICYGAFPTGEKRWLYGLDPGGQLSVYDDATSRRSLKDVIAVYVVSPLREGQPSRQDRPLGSGAQPMKLSPVDPQPGQVALENSSNVNPERTEQDQVQLPIIADYKNEDVEAPTPGVQCKHSGCTNYARYGPRTDGEDTAVSCLEHKGPDCKQLVFPAQLVEQRTGNNGGMVFRWL